MTPIISIKGLNKTYASGHEALTNINLDITKARSSRCSGQTAPARRR